MADESPDIGAAIRDYLKDSTVLIDVNHLSTPNNIYVGLPKKNGQLTVPRFTDFISVITGRGGQGEIGLSLFEERIDIYCYGSNEAKCKRIARALMWYIHPQDVRRSSSFIRKNCRVYDMTLEGGPLTLTDPDAADWPYTTVTYIAKYSLVPVI